MKKPAPSSGARPVHGSGTLIRFSGQFAQLQVAELHRRAFRLQTEVAALGIAVGPARDLFSIHPQTDLAIDGAHIVVVPFAHSLATLLGWEAARAIR